MYREHSSTFAPEYLGSFIPPRRCGFRLIWRHALMKATELFLLGALSRRRREKSLISGLHVGGWARVLKDREHPSAYVRT